MSTNWERSHNPLADTMLNGRMAEHTIEDRLDDLWPDYVEKIGGDSYDWSLEVYFTDRTPADFSISPQEAVEIFAFGFRKFWLNFADGSEQAGWTADGSYKVGERQPKRSKPSLKMRIKTAWATFGKRALWEWR